jgi:hypothetical protein
MTFNTDKTITPVLKVSTYIMTSITVRSIGLATILVISSVSTFKAVVIINIEKIGV